MRLRQGRAQAVQHIKALHQSQPGERLFITSVLNYAGWERHYASGLTSIRGYALIGPRVKQVFIPPPEEAPLLERRVTLAWLYVRTLLGEDGLVTMPVDALDWGTNGRPQERTIATTAAHFLIPEAAVVAANSIEELAWRCDVTPQLAELRLQTVPPELMLRYLEHAGEWHRIRPDGRRAAR